MTARSAPAALAALLLIAFAQGTGATAPADAPDWSAPGWASKSAPGPVQIAQNFQNPQGFRVVNVIAVHSRKCFDVRGASLANGAPVQQWDCVGARQTNQRYRIVRVPGGVFQIVAEHSGKCLDVRGAGLANGNAIQQWDCVGPQQTNQVFRLR